MILLSVLLATLVAPRSPALRPTVPLDTLVVSGIVRDQNTKAPIAGVSVHARQANMGTISAIDGRYRLLVVVARNRTVDIIARRIGYTPDSRRVNVYAGAMTIDFALVPSVNQLDAVVVSSESTRTTSSKTLGASVSVANGAAAVGPVPAGYNITPLVRAADAVKRHPAGSRDSAIREQYAAMVENPFLNSTRTPLSTFAIDVDRASYSDVRRHLDAGRRPSRDAVRIEELVNYFQYDYTAPARGAAPLDVTVETHAAPWQPSHRLIRIGMQAQRLPIAELPPSNLVFLVDVSGSMAEENKLPLVIKSLRLLTRELRPQDRVAIVVYAGAAGLVLPPTRGTEKTRIYDALDRLQAGGSTNGGAGIRLAYQTAREHFVSEGANRVIIATDGDFNVGTTSDADLVQLIETERKSGVFLTVLGFGLGNTQHAKMEQLADKGNGQYAYIDDIAEAQKALVREMGGTLFTLAKDVKIQVEFNPSRVRSYRLIKYENRLLRDEDFNDDTKDAGELGAGHSVTALYEVELIDAPRIVSTGTVAPLRYQGGRPNRTPRSGEELAFVKVRYQAPQGGRSELLSWPVMESSGAPSVDYTFASAVAGFGLLLRDSEHKGNVSWTLIRSLAEGGLGTDREGDRARFLQLVGTAERVMTTTAGATKDDR